MLKSQVTSLMAQQQRIRLQCQTQVRSLGQEDPLEEEVTTCSSILAEKWATVHGLQTMGSQRVSHV